MNQKPFFMKAITVFTMIVVLLAALPVSPALAATLGPNNPGVGADVSGVGTVTWTNPGNITTPTGAPYVTATLAAGTTSHYLRATNYNFNIPYGSTINGIELQINHQSSGTSNPSINDNVVSLVKGGVITGQNKAQTAVNWPRGAFGIATYGSASDLWGTTWTFNDINSTNFGAVLAVTDGHPSLSRTATVDYMQITVTYTLPNNTTTVNCGSGNAVVTYGANISCVATVTRNAGSNTPNGSVTWTTDGSGTFGSSFCAQDTNAGTLTCTSAYTPSAVGTGTHTITATYSGDANFNGNQGWQAVSVNKRDAAVIANAKSKDYGDDNPTLTATVVGEVAGGDVISYTLSTPAVKLSNAGGYPITVTLGTNPNYTVTPANNTLSVNPKAASVTAQAKSKSYGDDNPTLTATVVGEVVGGDVISYTLSTTALKFSDVGSYPITTTLGANPNYTVTPANSTLSVNPKAAIVTADSNGKTYGDDNPTLTATVVGEVVGGDVISYTLSTTALKFSNVGDYPITITLGSNPNYTVTHTNSTLTVSPKTATVTAEAKSKAYGDDNPTLTATVTGEAAGGDAISYTLSTTAVKLSNAGSYPITVTLWANPNYTITPTNSTLTVDPKTATVNAEAKSKAYGDDNPALSATVVGEVVGGDVISYTLSTTALKFSDVGSYPITVTLGTNPNYTVTPTNGTLTITPKAATVRADVKSKTYGDDNPALTATLTGEVVGGDVISYTLSTTAVKLSNVGDYPITVTLGTNPNYTVTPTNSTLTVTPKAATVTANNLPKDYGADNPALTATVAGEVVGGDVINYTLATTAVKLSNVGDYLITVTLGANPNYTVTPVNGLLSVTPKAATVKADNKTKTYGSDNPALNATVVGEVTGGDVISYTLSTTAVKLSSVGDYPITVTLGANPNYTVTPTDGVLTVTKITIVAAADNKSKIFGQTDPPLTYQVTSGSLLAGDAFAGALTREPGEAVGPYAILKGTLALPAYYDLTFVGAIFTIQTASPALTLVKTATPQTFAKAGDVIQYSFVLTNSGNTPLDGPFTVADDKATDEACPATASLTVGATLTCTSSYTITHEDVIAGKVTNTATATGSFASLPVVSNSAEATVKTNRLFMPIMSK